MILCRLAPEWQAQVFRPTPAEGLIAPEDRDEILWCVRELGFLLPVRQGALVLVWPVGYAPVEDLPRALALDFPSFWERVCASRPAHGDLQALGTALPRVRHPIFKQMGWLLDKKWGWPFHEAVAHAFLGGIGVLENPAEMTATSDP